MSCRPISLKMIFAFFFFFLNQSNTIPYSVNQRKCLFCTSSQRTEFVKVVTISTCQHGTHLNNAKTISEYLKKTFQTGLYFVQHADVSGKYKFKSHITQYILYILHILYMYITKNNDSNISTVHLVASLQCDDFVEAVDFAMLVWDVLNLRLNT